MMGGIVGRLFREFAMTLTVAIAISLVVSLTTTPMMCAAPLKPATGRPRGRLYRASERAFDWMLGRYDTTLSWALRHPRVMIFLTLVTVVVNVVLFIMVPKGFFPQQDTGRLTGSIQAAQDVSFQAMEKKLTEVVGIIRKDPAVESVTSFTGGGGGRGATRNTARMFIALKPRNERKLSADQVIARLRRELAGVPGAPVFLQAVQDLRIGGRASNAQYQYTLQGESVGQLSTWARRVEQRLRTLPQVVDLNSDQQDKGLATSLVIDRRTTARLGITPQLIDDTLYDAFGQRQVSVMYTALNQYHVVMEVAPAFWQRPDTLRDIYVRSPAGTMVPLSAFSRYEQAATTHAVNHQSQFPSVTLSFNVPPGVSLGETVEAVERATHDLGLPASIRGSFQGTAQAFQASLANQPLLILPRWSPSTSCSGSWTRATSTP
jgi:multidrug efflux pump